MKPFEVAERSLFELLNLKHYKLEIPAYQRPYEWKEKDIALLLNDIYSTLGASPPEDYMLLGSVLLRSKSSDRSLDLKSCDVVDGQQRLSTIMLLYSALYKKAEELQAKRQDSQQVQSEKLDQACKSMSSRFITDESERVLELRHALGGAADEVLGRVEQSWKSLTWFGNAELDTGNLLERKDRYVMRWNNTHQWVQKRCGTETKVLNMLKHLDSRVYVSVTVIYDIRLALKCFVNCNTTGVPLAPSDILKVLLVSNKGKRETFPLLTVWNNCKVDLLKASQSLKEQRGRSFWGKVLASKTVRSGPSEFQATSMDDLLAHLKSINDPDCKHLSMSYMDYMAHHYTYGTGERKAIGLHRLPNEFATEVLESYCGALIHLFNGRPFAKADLGTLSSAAVNDFKHIVQGLLDDVDWRPVALIVMVKADKCRKKGVKGILEALVKFLLNLEHLAVLLALLNTKKSGQNIKWRKQRYGQVMKLLDSQLQAPEHFVKQLGIVVDQIWSSLPSVQRLGSSGKEKLDQGSAIQRMNVMHLYVDSKADETREELAECTADVSLAVSEAEAEAAAEAAAEAEVEALAAAQSAVEADTLADAEDEDEEQSQAVEEDTVEAERQGPRLVRTAAPAGLAAAALTKAAQADRDKRSMKNNRLARALLLMLEHQGTNRNKTGAPRWSGKISIEHILPRNIRKPGAGWDRCWTSEKQSEWLHRLGNLAMLNASDNSSLGNCSFQDKIAKIEKFQDSASWTVKDLLRTHGRKEWDEGSVQQRHDHLLSVFRERWGVNTAATAGEGPGQTERKKPASSSRAPSTGTTAPAGAAAFQAADQFAGKQPGYLFQWGPQGKGYYRDKGQVAVSDNKKAGPATSAQSAGDALASATAASLKRSGQSKASGIDGSKAGHSSVSDDMPGAKLEAAATGSLNTSEGAAMDRSGKECVQDEGMPTCEESMTVDGNAAPQVRPKSGDKQAKPPLAAPKAKQHKGKKAGCFMLVPTNPLKDSIKLLLNQTYKVGRTARYNDIVIPSSTVSRWHATIQPGALGKERKQINVYNHSREGTSVNGKMLVQDGVRPTVAKLGSVIKFGYHDGYTDTDEETEDDSQDQDEVVEPYEEQSEEASKGGQQDAADEESETDLEQESGQDGESYTLEWRMFEDGDGN